LTGKIGAGFIGSQPQIGDIIVYRDDTGKITHSGIFCGINHGNIYIVSKWGKGGLHKHKVSAVPSDAGSTYEIYHTDRPDNRLLKPDAQEGSMRWDSGFLSGTLSTEV